MCIRLLRSDIVGILGVQHHFELPQPLPEHKRSGTLRLPLGLEYSRRDQDGSSLDRRMSDGLKMLSTENILVAPGLLSC